MHRETLCGFNRPIGRVHLRTLRFGGWYRSLICYHGYNVALKASVTTDRSLTQPVSEYEQPLLAPTLDCLTIVG